MQSVMARKVTAVSAAMIMLGSLPSCTPTVVSTPGPVTAVADSALNQQIFTVPEPSAYVMRANDIVQVRVFREADLSQDRVVVAADGTISLPLVGEVAVAGRSLAEVERTIETALGARYLRNPDVAISVIEYASHQVTVEGAVETPGVYPFQPGTRLSGGIALAEGLEREASRSDIAVFRQGEHGLELAKFDYSAMQAGTMIDPELQPGDRIVVGTDQLSQAWQDLLKALPAFALFTQI
jgi:polysaccharide biosynthesis/export protein